MQRGRSYSFFAFYHSAVSDPRLLPLCRLTDASVLTISLFFRSVHAALSRLHPSVPTKRIPCGVLCEPRHGATDLATCSPFATPLLAIPALPCRISSRRPARSPLLGTRASLSPPLAPALFPSFHCVLRVPQPSPAIILLFVVFWCMVKRFHNDLLAASDTPTVGFRDKN